MFAHFLLISLFIFTGDDSADSGNETTEEVDNDSSAVTGGNTNEVDNGDLVSNIESSVSSELDNTKYYEVKAGDSLSRISKKVYGDSKHYLYIYNANSQKMKSPSSVKVGQKLIIPPLP